MEVPTFVFLSLCLVSTQLSQADILDFRPNPKDKLSRPNVLFLIVDDLKVDALGAYGSNVSITPNIDWLASRSTVFKHAYIQQALCGPSRTSMLTSRGPDTTRSYDLKTYWRQSAGPFMTLPGFFKMKGYDAQGIGKVFHGGNSSPKHDFPYSWNRKTKKPIGKRHHAGQELCDVDGVLENRLFCPVAYTFDLHDNQVQNLAVHYLENVRKMSRTPFFLAVGFYRPHKPYVVPQPYVDLYPQQSMKVVRNGKIPDNMPPVAYNPLQFQRHEEIKNLNLSSYEYVSDELQKKFRQFYHASVSWTDDNIGYVLQALKDNGFGDNTIVNLIVDHGYQLGEHGMYGKYSNFEEAVNVPWILFDPNVDGSLSSFEHVSPLDRSNRPSLEPKLVVNTHVEALDLFPTLLEVTGLGTMPQCRGHDRFREFCTQGQSRAAVRLHDHESFAISQYPRSSDQVSSQSVIPRSNQIKFMGYSIRYRHHRFTWWVPFNFSTGLADFENTTAMELYDYESDPGGDINRAEESGVQSLISELKAKIVRWLPQNR